MENTALVSGAQHGLTVTAMALLEPGDVVAADALTYPASSLPPKPAGSNCCRFQQRGVARTLMLWCSYADGARCAPSIQCPRCTTHLDG